MTLPNGFTRVQIGSAISPRRLELTILPTEKCNFRCTYCYEDFLLGTMPKPVVDGICNMVSRRADSGLEHLVLAWFGGEPLLALNVIRRVARHSCEVADRTGLELTGGLTTNAYKLAPDVLGELVALRQTLFQISLDGWGEVHDGTRRRADGKGTFDVIWGNLLKAAETPHKFHFILRVHVTDQNHASLRVLCEAIRRNFGGDERFVVNFQDVRNMGGQSASTVTPISPRTFHAIKRDLQGVLDGRAVDPSGLQPASDEPALGEDTKFRAESAGSRREFADTENYICYAAKPNHFLIRADGRVGKCTVALSDPRNTIGQLKPDGTIEIDQELARKWSIGLETLDVDKLACPIVHWQQEPKKAEFPARLVVLA